MKKHPAIIVATLGHGLNDVYNGFFTPLLPLLSVNFHLSIGSLGLLSSLLLISSTLPQPVFGYLSDRLWKASPVVLGPILTAIFISLVGVVNHTFLLALVVLLAGLSTAAFHPPAAAMIHRASDAHRSFVMAMFAASGTLGLAFGPIIILPIVLRYGLERIYLAAAPALVFALLLLPVSRTLDTSGQPRPVADTGASFPRSRSTRASIAILWLIVALRATLINSLRTFLPMLSIERGQTIMVGGLAVAIFLAAGAVGELSGGYLADRFGNKNVIVVSLASGIPVTLGFLLSDGYLAMGLLFLAGFVLFSSVSVNVVMGQHLMAAHASTAAGIMGLAWGIGSLTTVAVGFLGDLLGLRAALILTTLILGPGVVLANLLTDS